MHTTRNLNLRQIVHFRHRSARTSLVCAWVYFHTRPIVLFSAVLAAGNLVALNAISFKGLRAPAPSEILSYSRGLFWEATKNTTLCVTESYSLGSNKREPPDSTTCGIPRHERKRRMIEKVAAAPIAFSSTDSHSRVSHRCRSTHCGLNRAAARVSLIWPQPQRVAYTLPV